jgi:hypothetical protein
MPQKILSTFTMVRAMREQQIARQADERGPILRDVVTAARERGWNFVIE